MRNSRKRKNVVTTAKRRRFGLWPIALILIGVGLWSTFFTISIHPSEGGAKSVALVSAAITPPVNIGGYEISGRGAMFSVDTKKQTFDSFGCQREFAETHREFPLTNDILVLTVSGTTLCAEKGVPVVYENLHLRPVDLFVRVNEGGLQLNHSNGSPIDFRKIEYWIEPTLAEKLTTILGSAAGGLGVGVATALLVEHDSRRRKGLLDQRKNVSQSG